MIYSKGFHKEILKVSLIYLSLIHGQQLIAAENSPSRGSISYSRVGRLDGFLATLGGNLSKLVLNTSNAQSE